MGLADRPVQNRYNVRNHGLCSGTLGVGVSGGTKLEMEASEHFFDSAKLADFIQLL